ncbi:putative adenosine triphosphatase/DNA packaging protein [Diachasmimorpha longicaudata entomopoxvirus]|uniref:DNA packaging protein OPG160 n=1 Tax=Diachasmimorpha longicaudata entomopoxvirus TaxID=109981 RepID=A0A7R5WNN1_9POXV|nr:putative adenosine triphosphatase/DNA packaging protein [Diachasmimorpha longicaudata entomopoxvirus]AKS26336.1 putative adenosine triphosphatase/DNA packaging protein [Diachasmimorpha longicaudata entomopoxvirus]
MLQFKISDLLDLSTFSIALMGPSGCGKTTLLKVILDQCKDFFSLSYLIQGSSPSEDNIYSSYIWPNNMIFLTSGANRKKQLQEIMGQMTSLGQEMVKINNNIKDENARGVNGISNRKPIRTLFVMDDLGCDLRVFEQFGNVSRHYGFYFLFIIHNDTNLTKLLRKNITHYFISVSAQPEQIMDDFKHLTSAFIEHQREFKSSSLRKAFLVLEREKDSVDYIALERNELEAVKSHFPVINNFSKLKQIYGSHLKNIAQKLLKAEESVVSKDIQNVKTIKNVKDINEIKNMESSDDDCCTLSKID